MEMYKNKIALVLGIVLALVFFVGVGSAEFAPLANKSKVIDNVTLDGLNSVSVSSNQIMNISVFATLGNGNNKNAWYSTLYQIGSEIPVCVDNSNHYGNDLITFDSFNINAPVALGSYSLNVTIYDDDACTTYPSSVFSLGNAINVVCVNNIQNTSWTSWTDVGCAPLFFRMNQSQTLVEYDANNCGNFTNVTYYNYTLVGPNYLNDDWSSWADVGCAGSQMNQSRTANQYDSYGCAANNTAYDYRLIGPNLFNTSWGGWENSGTCLVNDTQLQVQNLTQYDGYGCDTNQTFYNYSEIPCNYCSFSEANTTWSEWTNISCLTDNTMNQSKSLTQYDFNYDSCYAVTGLPSDYLANQTFVEYRNTEYCKYDTIAPNITAPMDVVAEATGVMTSVSLGSPNVSDNFDSSPVVTNDAPAFFPLGVTIVNWTATDASNNSATATQIVNITDTTAPSLNLTGSDLIVLLVNESYVEFGAVADDIVDGNLTANITEIGSVDTSTIGVYILNYSVSDSAGNSASVNRTVAVTYQPVANDDNYSIYNIGEPGVLLNDIRAYPITVYLVQKPNQGKVKLNSTSGGLAYLRTNSSFNGVDYFTYKIGNGYFNSSVAYVYIGVNNSAPVALADKYYLNGSLVVDNSSLGILANDSDANGDSIYVHLVRGTSFGSLIYGSSGIFNYSTSKINGVDYFSYYATDNNLNSNPVECVFVMGINSAPIAAGDSYYTDENKTLNVNSSLGVKMNDADADGDLLLVKIVSTTTNGILSLDKVGGAFSYTPNKSFVGIDNFSYYLTDRDLNSNVVNVSIYVGVSLPTPPIPTPTPAGGGGGRGAGGACTTQWTCSDWGACTNGVQTRTCSYPEGNCAPLNAEPTLSQSCSLTNETTPVTPTNPTNPTGILGLTGAVIGTTAGKISLGVIGFLIVVGGGYWFIRWRRRH